MKLRLTISRRISLGFGILLFSMVIVFYSTYTTLSNSTTANDKITTINRPSVSSLEALKLLVVRSKMLIFNWAYIPSQTDHPDKEKLTQLAQKTYPELVNQIEQLSTNWTPSEEEEINQILEKIEQLFAIHQEVMELLPNFESYDDPASVFPAQFYMQDDGEIFIKTREILDDLNILIEKKRMQTNNETAIMQSSFGFLSQLMRWLGGVLFVFGVVVAFYTTQSIVKPVHKLKTLLMALSKGVFPARPIEAKDDEIGEMTQALNHVITGMISTKEFAVAVGAGKFNAQYKPLSDQDSLGLTLLEMRDDLAENERVLEQKVIERTAEVVEKQKEVEQQNEKISELYEEVTDSIKYAKGLQDAILPPPEFVEKVMPNSFILYKAKDIVSGDFYWVEEKNNKIYFAAVDCTGHGVPGAFMSIVGYNSLNESLNKHDNPGNILDGLNKGISKTLNNNSLNSTTKDGMDIALCCYDKKTKELQYAGAYNPLFLIRAGKVIQIKADKTAIGSYYEDTSKKYTNHTLQLIEGDSIYIFSDGYVDQFGGPKEKKYMSRRFREHLIALEGEEMNHQKISLNNALEEWKGSLEQVDDILVMGMKIH